MRILEVPRQLTSFDAPDSIRQSLSTEHPPPPPQDSRMCIRIRLLPAPHSDSTTAATSSAAAKGTMPSPASCPLPDGPIIKIILEAWDARDFGDSADALAAWFNARWRKSGYAVSAEVALEVLRANGRDEARRGAVLDVMSIRMRE